jgi:hypothetical protein
VARRWTADEMRLAQYGTYVTAMRNTLYALESGDATQVRARMEQIAREWRASNAASREELVRLDLALANRDTLQGAWDWVRHLDTVMTALHAGHIPQT